MAKKNARKTKPEIAAAALPAEAPPAGCGESLERLLREKDVHMAGIWFWRNGVAEEAEGDLDPRRFSVHNLFSGNLALSVASSAEKVSSRPGRPVAGQFPVNRIYSGAGCFRYA